MGAAVGADRFVARKGPSGPRRAGEGVEEEDQAVVAMEWLPGGGLQLCVTLLAAGFVIGSSGASVRDHAAHRRGDPIVDAAAAARRGTTARRGSSDCKACVNPSRPRREWSTRRWRGTRSCARGSEGASARPAAATDPSGWSFRISPRRGPPRRRLPRSAASRARSASVAASAHGYPESAMIGATGGSMGQINPSVNPSVGPVAAAAAAPRAGPRSLPPHHRPRRRRASVHRAEYGYQTMQMPGAMGAGVGRDGGGDGRRDRPRWVQPAGGNRPGDYRRRRGGGGGGAAQKKRQLLLLQQAAAPTTTAAAAAAAGWGQGREAP